MRISEDAQKLLKRHNSLFKNPVLLIYYSKSKGWWGIQRKVQVKQDENPFQNPTHMHYEKVDFIRYPIPNEPRPIYLDKEMEELVEKGVITLKKLGMYKYLILDYD